MVWSFSATCPAGHLEAQEHYDGATLSRLLKSGEPIHLRCARCASSWIASDEQRSRIDWALRQAT